jgi:hypothetical protein
VKFVSKKFIERARYRALFDPPAEVKKAIKFQQREKVKPRQSLVDTFEADTVIKPKTPWYKRKKTD